MAHQSNTSVVFETQKHTPKSQAAAAEKPAKETAMTYQQGFATGAF